MHTALLKAGRSLRRSSHASIATKFFRSIAIVVQRYMATPQAMFAQVNACPASQCAIVGRIKTAKRTT